MKLFKKEPDMKCWNCDKLISHKQAKLEPRKMPDPAKLVSGNEEAEKIIQEIKDIVPNDTFKNKLASPNQIFGLQEYEYRGHCPECKEEITCFWRGKDSYNKIQGAIVAPKIKPFSCMECKQEIDRGTQVWYSKRVVGDEKIIEFLITLCPNCKEENGYPFEYDLDSGIIE